MFAALLRSYVACSNRHLATIRQQLRFGVREELNLAPGNGYLLSLSSAPISLSVLTSSSAVLNFDASAEIDSVMSD